MCYACKCASYVQHWSVTSHRSRKSYWNDTDTQAPILFACIFFFWRVWQDTIFLRTLPYSLFGVLWWLLSFQGHCLWLSHIFFFYNWEVHCSMAMSNTSEDNICVLRIHKKTVFNDFAYYIKLMQLSTVSLAPTTWNSRDLPRDLILYFVTSKVQPGVGPRSVGIHFSVNSRATPRYSPAIAREVGGSVNNW